MGDWVCGLDFIDQEYLFSPIRCVFFIKYFSLILAYPNFITNLEPIGLDDNYSISPYRLKYTLLSFFSLLASTGSHFNGTVFGVIILVQYFWYVMILGITLESKFLPHFGFDCTVPSFANTRFFLIFG